MTVEILSRRALNRATMARQLLLQRDHRSAVEAVDHLVGLQAQEPFDPYLALWSRLADTLIVVQAPIHGSVLHDGFLCGTWSIERRADGVVLTVRHRLLTPAAIDEVLAEAQRALTFLEPSAARHDVRAESIRT